MFNFSNLQFTIYNLQFPIYNLQFFSQKKRPCVSFVSSEGLENCSTNNRQSEAAENPRPQVDGEGPSKKET